ncbi:diaminopimelate decarboxylase [Azospirillum brasilense]|uniref:diaminopimelate decarboxylase n=1 Tax=Azospirillum argentinense TaxID=2970906 RepID=UPI00190C30E8|nr:diaminopimelate decarboxylase [Azospirillum argentinense]MBK3799714.1 diaminopimelate decarboxylase [Azospirillum argentinense]
MSAFAYRNGVMHAESVPLSTIAAEVGTPFYCYSTAALEAHYSAYAGAFAGQDADVCYAVKANSNLAVIRAFARLGAGADVVSGGEMRRALAGGIPAGKIIFSGVGKTREEMRAALEAGIHQINVESIPEVEALSEVAVSLGVTAPIAFRVNPDVDAKTHAKIATGKKENKFGVDYDHAREVYAQAAKLPGIKPVAIAVHIGSQLTDLAPFRAAYERVAALLHVLREDGHDITRLDLGGGLGIVYKHEAPPDIADYAAMVKSITGNLGCRISLEPGRSLVGNAGILVSRVIYLKQGLHRRFVIIDAAMNDLIRPTLYEAYHGIVPVTEPAKGAVTEPYDVVGPVCESGDTFALQRALPAIAPDELVAILSAGAYGAVMSSTYNTRPLIPEVLVNGDQFSVIRPRVSVEELLALDRVPDWLKA